MRAHYTAPVQSPAGALQQGATVSVFASGSTAGGTQLGTLITNPVYADGSSSVTMTNPFISTSGDISFWLDFPMRVDLGIQVPGQAQAFFPEVDVTTAGTVPAVVTQSYNVSLSDQLVLASAAGGNVTLTLPLSSAGCEIRFKRTDSSGNTMGIAASGGQLIEGSAGPYALAALARARLYADGSAWWVV